MVLLEILICFHFIFRLFHNMADSRVGYTEHLSDFPIRMGPLSPQKEHQEIPLILFLPIDATLFLKPANSTMD